MAIAKFFWVVAIVGAILGGILVMATMAGANGAPQEAAGAAMACAFCIIPYVLARASEGLAKPMAARQPLTFDQLPAHMQQSIAAQQQAAAQPPQQGTGT
jgi:hypothetical protein